jgi:hypothetical protein
MKIKFRRNILFFFLFFFKINHNYSFMSGHIGLPKTSICANAIKDEHGAPTLQPRKTWVHGPATIDPNAVIPTKPDSQTLTDIMREEIMNASTEQLESMGLTEMQREDLKSPDLLYEDAQLMAKTLKQQSPETLHLFKVLEMYLRIYLPYGIPTDMISYTSAMLNLTTLLFVLKVPSRSWIMKWAWVVSRNLFPIHIQIESYKQEILPEMMQQMEAWDKEHPNEEDRANNPFRHNVELVGSVNQKIEAKLRDLFLFVNQMVVMMQHRTDLFEAAKTTHILIKNEDLGRKEDASGDFIPQGTSTRLVHASDCVNRPSHSERQRLRLNTEKMMEIMRWYDISPESDTPIALAYNEAKRYNRGLKKQRRKQRQKKVHDDGFGGYVVREVEDEEKESDTESVETTPTEYWTKIN